MQASTNVVESLIGPDRINIGSATATNNDIPVLLDSFHIELIIEVRAEHHDLVKAVVREPRKSAFNERFGKPVGFARCSIVRKIHIVESGGAVDGHISSVFSGGVE